MAKAFYYFKGKCKWAQKLFIPDDMYKCWSVMLYPDKESYDKIMELKAGKEGIQGLLNVIKKDEEGYNLTFKRPTEKVMKGKLQSFTPPVIVNAEGQPWDRDKGIGHGSDLTLKVEWYSYKRPTGGHGSAIRLESVRVDSLVPFEKDDFPPQEQKQVGGLLEQPAPLF